MNKKIYELSYLLKRERRQKITKALLAVLTFFIAANLFLTFCITPVKQRSISMEPNIKKNAFLIARPLLPISYPRKMKRGQVVLVSRPTDKEPSFAEKCTDFVIRALTFHKVHPYTMDNAFLARVAAMPGDTISMKDFVLYVTPPGESFAFTEFELNQISYSIDIRVPPSGWNTQIGVRGNFDKRTLGNGEYFVLCDNRLSSMDSRIFGPVEEKNIKHKILFTYFPLSSFGLFHEKK